MNDYYPKYITDSSESIRKKNNPLGKNWKNKFIEEKE